MVDSLLRHLTKTGLITGVKALMLLSFSKKLIAATRRKTAYAGDSAICCARVCRSCRLNRNSPIRSAVMKASGFQSFPAIAPTDCELSDVLPGWAGEKVKTAARIKIRTYTAIMPPTINAIAFRTLFARLFLIASCSLIRESCSANASGCSSSSIFEPSSRLTGTSKISANFIRSSESGTERPVSLN